MKRSTPINVHHQSQESQKALFSIFSGLVGMLSLMQFTQVPKSVNYYLPTFIFYMEIYFNLQSHNKNIFKFTKTPLYVNINMQK
jgi:uncharacterized membrane protein YobD (UPF0266 family)